MRRQNALCNRLSVISVIVFNYSFSYYFFAATVMGDAMTRCDIKGLSPRNVENSPLKHERSGPTKHERLQVATRRVLKRGFR